MNEESIFAAVRTLKSLSQRAAFLDQACGDDEQLRAQVEDLLRFADEAEGFLDRRAPGLDGTVDLDKDALQAGLSRAFGADAAVVIGEQGHSVLRSISKKLPATPSVMLRESDSERESVVRPQSAEVPKDSHDAKYQLLGEVARGGMGAIIKGRDSDLGRDLAIKVLLDSHRDKPEVVQRFVEEAQIGGQLQHPGIVPVYELGQFSDERPFFSMKLVKGKTLASLLAERQDPSQDQAHLLGIFEQVCQTMAYAHSRGVIHRDLKPANIMVGAFGEVQVMDWGLAKVLGEGGTADEKRSLDKQRDVSVIRTRRSTGSDAPGEVGSETNVGSVMGTPAYMPPEQALGEVDRLDERADVFGLGAILCEILTGKPPYVGKDSTEVFRQATRGKLDDCYARLDATGVDPQLLRLAKQSLDAEPDTRLRNAGAMADAVTKYLEGVQDRLKEAELETARGQARRKLYVAIAGLMLLIAVGAAAAALVFRRQREVQTQLARSESSARQEAVKQLRRATVAEADARQAERQAITELHVSNAMRFAAQSRSVAGELPVQSLLLAMAAVDETRNFNGTVLAVAHETLLNAVPRVGGIPLLAFGTPEEQIDAPMAISADGQWLATGGMNNTVRLWSLTAADVAASAITLGGDGEAAFGPVVFTPDSKRLITGPGDTLRMWFLNDPRSYVEFPRHKQAIFCAAVSTDGRWLASGDIDGSARLWDLKAPNPENSGRALSGHTDTITGAAFSSDSQWLATGDYKGMVKLWDLSAVGAEIPSFTLDEHQSSRRPNERPLAFSPDGRRLASATAGNKVRLWDVTPTGPSESYLELQAHAGRVRSVAFNSDQWLATGSSDGTARLWDLTAKDPSTAYREFRGHNGPINSVAISPDGRWLGTASDDHTARLWDLHVEGAPREFVLRAHDGLVMSVAFSPDSRRFVTGSRDGTARVWDLTSENPATPLVLQRQGNGPVAISADGQWLAAASADGVRVRRYDSYATSPWKLLPGGADLLVGPTALLRPPWVTLTIGPNSRWLAASVHNTVRLWDLHSPGFSDFVTLSAHTDLVESVVFNSDGRWLVTGSRDDTARIWDLSQDDPAMSPRVLSEHLNDVRRVAIDANGHWLATCSRDGTVRLWDFEAADLGESSIQLRAAGPCNRVAISADGHWLAASDYDWGGVEARVLLWDLRAPDIASSVQAIGRHPKAVIGVQFSPDSRWLVSGSWDTTARVWDLTKDDIAASNHHLRGHSGSIDGLAICPNSRWLATRAEDKTVRLWNLQAENPAADSLVLRTGHHSIAFSPNGRRLITGGPTTLSIWDLELDPLIERAARLAGRELTVSERDRYMLPAP